MNNLKRNSLICKTIKLFVLSCQYLKSKRHPAFPANLLNFNADQSKIHRHHSSLRQNLNYRSAPSGSRDATFHASCRQKPDAPCHRLYAARPAGQAPRYVFPGFGLHPEPASSSPRTAESCSFYYGLPVPLRLLPTPPHGDAVTFDYREGSISRERTCASQSASPARRTNCGRQPASESLPCFFGFPLIT